MKLIYLLTTAILGLTLAGCTTEELDSLTNTQQNAIDFSALNTHVGRALLIDNSNIKNYDFNVYAYTKDGKTFMGDNSWYGGITIRYNNTSPNPSWVYMNESDIRYWPTETDANALNFYAIMPIISRDSPAFPRFLWEFTHNKQQIHYSMVDEYNNAENDFNLDILYAIANNMKLSNSNAGKVPLQFNHALSQVVFQAKTRHNNIQVDIQELKIVNLKLAGLFTLPTSTSPAKWQYKDSISYEPIDENDENIVRASVMPHLNVFNPTEGRIISVTESLTDISTDDKPLLVLPQTLTAWNFAIGAGDDKTQSCLKIKCRIKQNGTYVHGKSDYEYLYMPFGVTWQPGKRYIYTLIFGGGYDQNGNPILSPINFEASTEGWVESTSNIKANE